MAVTEVLIALTKIFILIIPGVIFKKKNVIDEHQSVAISSLIVNLTWPCLVIDAMQMPFSMDILKSSGYIFLISMGVFAIALIISLPVAKLLKMKKTQTYVFMFMILFGNTGFLGIPVINALYGQEALFYAAIVEMVCNIMIFTIGIVLIQMSAGASLKMNPREFFSPGLMGIFLGMILFLLNIQLPEILGGSIKILGAATTPLSMFIIGYQVAGLKLKELFGDKNIYAVSVVKLLVTPIILLLLVKLITPDLSLMTKVTVLEFAMPAAAVTVIFTKQYKGEVDFATKGVLVTTLLSIITIPIFAVLLELL